METAKGARQPNFMTGMALLFPITLSVMAALFVAPIAPKIGEFYAKTGAYSPDVLGSYIGWIITVPSLCVALFSIPAGWLGDKVGRRRLLVMAMSVYSAVGVLPYFLNNLNLIVASRIAVGIVEAMLMTLSTTLIGDFFSGERRDRWLAAQTGVASTTAMIIVPIAGIVGQSDWHNVFLLYLVPLLFLALVLLFTWEPEESEHLVDHSVERRWSDIPWGLMGIICLITLFGGVMFYFVQIKLSDALYALGVSLPIGSYDSARGGLFIMLASAGVPLGTLCFWGLAPRFSLKTMFLLEFILMGAGFLLMSMIKAPLHFAFAAALNQIGAGMLLPTLLTWAVSKLPFEIRGRGTGIWTATFALAQFVCNNMAVPFVMRFTHGIIPTIGVLGWACLGAAVIALLMRLKPSNG